jgi:hypothetical protein
VKIKMLRMNLDQNPPPKGVKTSNLPAIYFFPTTKKSAPYLTYADNFGTKNLINFLQSHASASFPTPKVTEKAQKWETHEALEL